MNQVRVAPSSIEGQTPAPQVQQVQIPTNAQQPLTTMQVPQPSGPTQFTAQQLQPVPTPQYTPHPPIGQASMPPPAPAQMYVQPSPSWQMAPPQSGPFVLQLNPRNTSSRRIENYNSTRSKTLGVLQLVFGGIALIFNVFGIIVQSRAYDATHESYDDNSNYYGHYYFEDSDGYYVSPAIWGGVFFALSGAFALCSAAKKTCCLIVTQMIMGIIASVCAFITLFIAIWIITEDAHRISKGFDYDIHHYNNGSRWNKMSHSAKAEGYAKGCMAVSVLFLLSSIPIVVVTVWSSTLGCKICCSDTHVQQSESEHVQYQSNMGSGQPQVLVLDGRGRPVPGAQIIPISGPSVEQAPLMQAQSLQQPAVDSKNPGLLPPPYE